MPKDLVEEGKVSELCNNIIRQFHSRTVVEGKKTDINHELSLKIEHKFKSMWLTFSKGKQSHTVTIPTPFLRNSVNLITQNEVERAVCSYYIKEREQIVDYLSAIYLIVCSDPTGLVPDFLVKGTPFIQRVVDSFRYGNAPTIIYNLQRAVNEVANRMPLHETDMNSWAMNRRLLIVDPKFDELRNPAERLNYQVEKSRENFHKGWTSIGLSDGVLANKNYILTTDIRKLSPFGLRYNNPGRNLYSTLGMKGDELPLVKSRSMQELLDKGIVDTKIDPSTERMIAAGKAILKLKLKPTLKASPGGISRKGWNLFTLFANLPDVFEDQILIDKRHANKFVTYEKRYQCFGELLIKKGDFLKKGRKLSIAADGEIKRFDLDAPRAKAIKVSKSKTNIGGIETDVYNIIVEYRRYFKDGTKITNLHGNKGVVRLMDLGYAIDPRTGKPRKIDIISAAQSIKKRKNFGQILEALTNTVNGDKDTVCEDDLYVPIEAIEDQLVKCGLPADGTWMCHTYAGEITGVCGTVFWGVIGQPEGSLWENDATTKKNGRELRTAGLKFSTVEMRALQTRFGKDNPILDEILSYMQGTEDLHEKFTILKSKRGQFPSDKPTIDVRDVKPVNQSAGIIMEQSVVSGTVVDETFQPGGFLLQLPLPYRTHLEDKETLNLVTEGMAPGPYEPGCVVYTTDKVYIPHSNLRKCWRHDTGKFGLSEIGALVNNIIIASNRLLVRPEDQINYTLYYNAVATYFRRISDMMGGKRGDISTYGMSVRYPYSAKAKATLSNSLPRNTIEIHKDMAKKLNVVNGDVVLVERFPCLGFMSIRPQKVHITESLLCKYTIRASKNSLGSLSLDFDGDDLYLASFHTPEAKEALRKEWKNPNKACYDIIKELNKKAGVPHTKCMGLQDYNITPFIDLDVESHAELVKRATGVKSHTGPVIALAYNVMRLIENSDVADNQRANIAIELFLDKVGNSVFKQKHGVQSLHDIVIDAICTADVNLLVEYGFKRGTSTVICDIIKEKAKGLKKPVHNLRSYHQFIKKNGASNIINRIVREQNKIYFASRAQLEACKLLAHIEQPALDVPSRILYLILSGKYNSVITPLEEHKQQESLEQLFSDNAKEACKALHRLVDDIFRVNPPSKEKIIAVGKAIMKQRSKRKSTDRMIACGKAIMKQRSRRKSRDKMIACGKIIKKKRF